MSFKCSKKELPLCIVGYTNELAETDKRIENVPQGQEA